ncbi:NADH-quinone oxidoreductase subunit C [bacterium]|nr:NADH-quinone oxidoreductase subunit C [bacterium]
MSVRTTFVPFVVPQADPPGTEIKDIKIEDIAAKLKSVCGADSVERVETEHKGDPFIVLKTEKLHEVVNYLRDDSEFRYIYPSVIAATDFLAVEEGEEKKPGRIEVVYVLFSLKNKHQLTLKVCLDRKEPEVQSVADLYRAANWYERECFDMVGVHFKGHPDHKRILLPEDWVGYPLRKDYEFPQEYNGMKVPL